MNTKVHIKIKLNQILRERIENNKIKKNIYIYITIKKLMIKFNIINN
jgi:hypothetical protein